MLMEMGIVLMMVLWLLKVVLILILELTRSFDSSENTVIDDGINNDVGGSNDWLY